MEIEIGVRIRGPGLYVVRSLDQHGRVACFNRDTGERRWS
jgi:hypothetical protein